jgi:hypothetical protein
VVEVALLAGDFATSPYCSSSSSTGYWSVLLSVAVHVVAYSSQSREKWKNPLQRSSIDHHTRERERERGRREERERIQTRQNCTPFFENGVVSACGDRCATRRIAQLPRGNSVKPVFRAGLSRNGYIGQAGRRRIRLVAHGELGASGS